MDEEKKPKINQFIGSEPPGLPDMEKSSGTILSPKAELARKDKEILSKGVKIFQEAGNDPRKLNEALKTLKQIKFEESPYYADAQKYIGQIEAARKS